MWTAKHGRNLAKSGVVDSIDLMHMMSYVLPDLDELQGLVCADAAVLRHVLWRVGLGGAWCTLEPHGTADVLKHGTADVLNVCLDLWLNVQV